MTSRSELHQKNLHTLFYPKSVAIVGANNVRGTVPCDIVLNIINSGFNGKVFPVSPREKTVCGAKAYKYVVDIEESVDLAVMVFPSSVCDKALIQCGQKGIRSAIVISAGFREVGGDGLAREQHLKSIADTNNMSFIGPNCLGVINTDPISNLNASFARAMPAEGNIAFLSQSGALCTAVLDYARARHIGFSKFVSFGNKADISEIDLMCYLKNDPKTAVICLYLEEISDGPGLMKAAREIITETHKPILILKSGRTSEGASAAASHTGSLAGSDEICDAAFRQAGIIRCDNIEDMFNIAIAFSYQPTPAGNRIAVVTNAGGPGVLTTDAMIKSGLKLAKFSDSTIDNLKKILPVTAAVKNPVDVIGDATPERYAGAMASVMEDESVDGLFVIVTPQSMTDINAIAAQALKTSRQYKKPLYASFMGEADMAPGISFLQQNKIPHYFLPEAMARSCAAVCAFGKSIKPIKVESAALSGINREMAVAILDKAQKEKRVCLPEIEASQVLAAYGLPILPNRLVHSEQEAISAADGIGYPVAMKIMSDDIIHKSDVGGVVLNIRSSEEAQHAYQKIHESITRLVPTAKIAGIMVVKMAPPGEEVILGAKRDPSFGPVIMFGLGGIFVEVFKDVSFRVAPVSESDAIKMMTEIRAVAVLAGIRGRKPCDAEAIADCIVRLSQLAMDCPQIKELDINPLLVGEKGKGCFVADARIML